MRVTEEALSPFRADGKLRIRDLPSSIFSHTLELYFPSHDLPFSDVSNRQANRKVIEVIPVVAFLDWIPPLHPEREWIALQHQCGGYTCVQSRMIATLLAPKEAIKEKLDHIGRQFYFAQDGRLDGGQTLASSISAYSASLSAIGLDCEWTWRWLMEAHYPVDCTLENLNKIASDTPWPDLIAEGARYIEAPMILLLADNSD